MKARTICRYVLHCRFISAPHRIACCSTRLQADGAMIWFADSTGSIEGSRQIRAHRRKRDDSNKGWKTGDRHVAGNMVLGVQGE